jgi:Holliday junction resolvase RusA-like endonuclease
MSAANLLPADALDGRASSSPRVRHHSGAVASPATGGAAASLTPPVTFRIPTPPSVNQAYRNTPHGRAKTKAYDDWLLTAFQMIRAQNAGALHGHCGLVIGVEREAHMKRADLDNRAKLILDAIVSAGVITDDRFVTFLAMCWLPPANGLAHIALFPASAMPALVPHASSDGATGAWVIRLHHTDNGDDDDVIDV